MATAVHGTQPHIPEHSRHCWIDRPSNALHTATQTCATSEASQLAEVHIEKSPVLSTQRQSTRLPPRGGIQTLRRQRPLQHAVPPGLQPLPFGMHIGVVVAVVLVDVEVVLVDVEVVGVVVLVDVEVVLVDVLVEVVVVVPHGSVVSPCPRCAPSALSETLKVFSSGVPGLWQMVTFCCRASAREGISAEMAVPAKSLSAPRRLIEPSASALANSSKDRLVDSWLTCCPLFPKDGARGIAPPSCTTKTSMRGYKIWRNFREFYKSEVQLRRIRLLRSSQNSYSTHSGE